MPMHKLRDIGFIEKVDHDGLPFVQTDERRRYAAVVSDGADNLMGRHFDQYISDTKSDVGPALGFWDGRWYRRFLCFLRTATYDWQRGGSQRACPPEFTPGHLFFHGILFDACGNNLILQIQNRMASTRFSNVIDDRDLYSGLIRLHILHHAAEAVVFGLGTSEELARHGHRISPGTLYPILHGLEKKGYLRSMERRIGRPYGGSTALPLLEEGAKGGQSKSP